MTSPAMPERDLAIDRFRGGLILLMVAGDYAAGVRAVPAALKHAPDVGLTVADLVAPGFVFAIGLTYGPSFARRAAASMGDAYRHVLTRYLALIGIGAILSAGSTAVAGLPSDWGVLQALGVAGLICLMFIRMGTIARAAIGAFILIGYQYLLDAWLLEAILGSSHGWFFGAIAWGGLLVLSTAIADVWRTGWRNYLICCGILVVVAASSVVIVLVSKNRVSLSYLLITVAVSALAFLLVDLASRGVPKRAGFVAWWGENPLVLYLVHLVILGLIVLPGLDWWYADAPLWLATAQLVAVLAAMSVLAWWLHRNRTVMRL
jgi:fucose 4-O-acetylase-like acetyltransferase